MEYQTLIMVHTKVSKKFNQMSLQYNTLFKSPLNSIRNKYQYKTNKLNIEVCLSLDEYHFINIKYISLATASLLAIQKYNISYKTVVVSTNQSRRS